MAVGCSTHAYTITDRSGAHIADSGDVLDVEYTRLLNDTSAATVSIGVSGPDCCGQLGQIRSWRHMLNIFRGGQFMWSGFITNIDWQGDRVIVSATDIIGLLDLRVPHQDMTFANTDLVEIARQLVEDGLAPEDPGHVTTVMGMSGTTGGRAYLKNIGQTADHLRDLADTGIDFTAVGSNIVILPDQFCEVVGRLSDEDLPEGLTVSEDGAMLATRQIVAGDEDSDVVGTAGGTNSYYGLLERYEEQTTITDQASADAAAAAKLSASLTVPVFIDTQDVTLNPNANVSVHQLVPGWCVDITSDYTCRPISQRLKITGLQISENGEQERITVQVSATGNTLAVT